MKYIKIENCIVCLENIKYVDIIKKGINFEYFGDEEEDINLELDKECPELALNRVMINLDRKE